MTEDITLKEGCRNYLHERWNRLLGQYPDGNPPDPLPDDQADLKELIRRGLTAHDKTYHYVLPTQVLCKVVNPELDCHSIQAQWNHPGAFDARTIAHEVIVPFDGVNFGVLGNAPSPYINNPVRVPAVTVEYRGNRKRIDEWNNLIAVLDIVEASGNPEFVKLIFDQILVDLIRLLQDVRVTYPVPNRASLDTTQRLIDDYTRVRSGGDRLEVLTAALIRTVGTRFNVFDDIRHERVNAADAASGMLADIECWLNQVIVFLVEVKDRPLTLTELDSKLQNARANSVTEILFIADSLEPADETAIQQRIVTEFSSGQNIYVMSFRDFADGLLALLGENGRVAFLREVCTELDKVKANIEHRREWAQLLRGA
ncbi:MAG: restriction endonuclease, SacI family [Chloroflexi bacterium]|nr:restriction endonuclease, SacI family [Chloroflexota bacterium]MCL5275380.1 restriction endonuclease, SacI family [Chloroflexota bacterium]